MKEKLVIEIPEGNTSCNGCPFEIHSDGSCAMPKYLAEIIDCTGYNFQKALIKKKK